MGHIITSIPFIAHPIKVKRMISASCDFFDLKEVPCDRAAKIGYIDDNKSHLLVEFYDGMRRTGEFMEFIAG